MDAKIPHHCQSDALSTELSRFRFGSIPSEGGAVKRHLTYLHMALTSPGVTPVMMSLQLIMAESGSH